MSDSHWAFIVAAYVVTAIVIGGMTLKILLEYRGLQRALGRMVGADTGRDDI